MKKIFVLIFLLILNAGLIWSQDVEFKKHSLTVGYGSAFQGSGDVTAPVLDFKYTYKFNEHLGISPRIMFGNGKGEADESGNFRISNISTYDLSLTILPFPESFDRLSFDIGVSYRHVYGMMGHGYRQTNTSGYVQYGNLLNYPQYTDENAIGLTAVIDYRIFSTEKVSLGARATNQSFYTNGDIAWVLSGYFEVKF
jgi:hypothetical protein